MLKNRLNFYDIVFAVITPREVVFFLAIADKLKERGLRVAFITFYEPGDKVIESRGYKVFSLHKEVETNISFSENDIIRLKRKYNMSNIRTLLLHEKYTFERYNEDKLLNKLICYDRYFERVLSENSIKTVAQELGGFIAPMSLYYNCIAKSVRHIFFEPAMYKGRLFFNVDSIDVKLKNVNVSKRNMEFIKDYLAKYNKSKTVVVPAKDRENFKSGIKRLLQLRYIKRFIGKVYSKYILREREEYDALLAQVKMHLKMFVFSKIQNRVYSNPDYSDEYIYFPLHVPLDFQLTIREPKYLNQIALVEYIAKILPYGYKLYIKEHPASIGAYNYRELKRVLYENHNVKLIRPNVNSYELIKNAKEIITINSKVGAEALMQGRRVFVLGKTYYLSARNAIGIKDPVEILPYLYDEVDLFFDYDFFANVYNSTIEAELYSDNVKDIDDFSRFLFEYL